MAGLRAVSSVEKNSVTAIGTERDGGGIAVGAHGGARDRADSLAGGESDARVVLREARLGEAGCAKSAGEGQRENPTVQGSSVIRAPASEWLLRMRGGEPSGAPSALKRGHILWLDDTSEKVAGKVIDT